jgi:Pyruvate/2-oxoacid:ferredoxin oxidoreductase delta subunit
MWYWYIIVIGVVVAGFLAFLLYAERGRLLRRSTVASARAGGLRRFFNLSFLHAYVYERWGNEYGRWGTMLLVMLHGRRWLTNRYHSKVLTHDCARAVVSLEVGERIPRHDLEHIVPYEKAREILLQGPVDIAVSECRCRRNKPNGCEPRDVCMAVGQPFAGFLLEHQPGSRKLSQAEALDLLKAEHERGHVHTAWFHDAMLGRFYALCNCCKCCCGGIGAMRAGMPMVTSSGYVAKVSAEECTACAVCVDACPFGAIAMEGDWAAVDWNKCMGCGVCEGQCLPKAISLTLDARKPAPLDVRALVEQR